MSWGYLLLRGGLALAVLALLYLSQRFWYRALWRMTSTWGRIWLRVGVRLLYLTALVLIILNIADSLRVSRGRVMPGHSALTSFAGLWFMAALGGYLCIKAVHIIEWAWHRLHKPTPQETKKLPLAKSALQLDFVPDPSRRTFFRTASVVAGAAPFLGVMYGYAGERLNYQVCRVEIPLANLPGQLEGMSIVQISDIHLSSYTSRESVRRVVDMANDVGADLAVVTGDLITGVHDSLVDCVDEVRRLRAPLGVYGCNGNHEIYARAEDLAARLYQQNGMRMLRRESAIISFRGAELNLIGVDYQRERTPSGRKMQMLANVEPLVRRDMPNILLSHNPNSFNRAAELGIELSLAGHTHGGQVQVEILDVSLSPARFITDYVAGLYHRPLLMPDEPRRLGETIKLMPNAPNGLAALYVNRGIGTVGAPVRLGAPPEITHIVLRRA
ncbi:MAG TPA: metallophosphoesterase [Candidatus Eremiobacteraceae bacterium]|nr:metallophosphoesterase [Candidatus Eremiobacteraceae bacterium]